MTPWFIATQPFSPEDGAKWDKYLKWSGLTQLQELVSLDGMLCPTILPEIKDDYWPHIVNEDFMLAYFLDFDFLMTQVAGIARKNVLGVFRNPVAQPVPPPVAEFEFLGYELVDLQNAASALTNCGAWPDVFDKSELSPFGLLPELERALDVQAMLRSLYPDEPHAQCHVWAVFRAL